MHVQLLENLYCKCCQVCCCCQQRINILFYKKENCSATDTGACLCKEDPTTENKWKTCCVCSQNFFTEIL